MEKDMIKERFAELMNANPPLKEIERLVNIALDSGHLIEGENQEAIYGNAKILWFAILSAMAEQWLPLCGDNLKTAKRLIKSIH